MLRHPVYLLLLSLIFYSPSRLAGPSLKVCLLADCQKPATVEISDAAWSQTKALFKGSLQTDIDEQDNIVNAIIIIENNIFLSLAQHTAQSKETKKLSQEIYSDISQDNHYRNLKNIIGLLLDKHLITHHYLRSSISLKNWTGIESTALLLQSLNTSRLYLLKIDNSGLEAPPVFMPYRDQPDTFGEHPIKPAPPQTTGN